MARLNDPPVPLPAPESIDALKRRFIRQNRELARVNSTQSLRIRNLETEISRLLSENIALREQAIAAEADRERWRGISALEEEIAKVKTALQDKLDEVRGLVGDLSNLPERCRVKDRRKSGVVVTEVVRSPGEKDWRNRQTLSGVLRVEADGQDGRLPAILEDKYYPRKTFEAVEIRELVDKAQEESLESPDLGPPPVAHFDETEPVAFDAGRKESTEDVVAQHVNLETRRKRRTSAFLQDLVNQTDEAEQESEPKSLLKSGAKRKLDVSDLEESSSVKLADQDDFVFHKTRTDPTAASTRFSRPLGRSNPSSAPLSPQKNAQPSRKALAPKSTNSPSKRPLTNLEKPSSPIKEISHITIEKPLLKVRMKPARPQPPMQTKPSSNSEPIREPLSSEIDPKTPAAPLTSLLSPPSTTTSTNPTSKPFRPQEAAITASVEDVLNGSLGRASRRNRPAVSYAEPNLRDKMRRSGKSLVGAVEGLGRPGESFAGAERGRSGSVEVGRLDGGTGREGVEVKQEPEEDVGEEEWKGLPMVGEGRGEVGSPLGDKHKPSVRDSGLQDRCVNVGDELDKAVGLLAIFDPPDSSPADDQQKSDPSKEQKTQGNSMAVRPARAQSRRHSVQPSSASNPIPASTSTSLIDHKANPSTTSRVPSSRPSSAASLRSSSGIKRTSSVNMLNRPASRNEEDIPGNRNGANSGSERSNGLGRRRSMMV